MSWLADFNEIFSMRLFHLRGLAQKNGEKVFALSTFEFSLSLSLSLSLTHTHYHRTPYTHPQTSTRTHTVFLHSTTNPLFICDGHLKDFQSLWKNSREKIWVEVKDQAVKMK